MESVIEAKNRNKTRKYNDYIKWVQTDEWKKNVTVKSQKDNQVHATFMH